MRRLAWLVPFVVCAIVAFLLTVYIGTFEWKLLDVSPGALVIVGAGAAISLLTYVTGVTDAKTELGSAFKKGTGHVIVEALQLAFGTSVFIVLGLVYATLRRGSAWQSATWAYPAWLLALVVIPFLLLLAVVSDRRVARIKLPSVVAVKSIEPSWRVRFRRLPMILRAAALFFGILALARPQSLLRAEVSEEQGIDIVLVLDLSGSMKAVMDGDQPTTQAPQGRRQIAKKATRLDTAKDVILDFIERRRTDRIGVVVFGPSAYVLSPPTLDYSLVANLVQHMQLGLISGEGTAIGDAVGTAVARLRRSTAKSKAIILLTDGDSNAGFVAPEYAASLAKAQSVKVYTVQIGNGDEVEVEAETDVHRQPHYVRQRFPVNPELLRKIASETAGESFVATDRAALERSMHDILDKLERTRLEGGTSTIEELFPLLLLPGGVLVLLEILVSLLILRRFP